MRQDHWIAPWGGIVGDDRKSIVPSIFVNYFRGDDGRSHNINLSPELDFKLASRFTTSLSVNYSRNTDNTQFFGNFQDNLGNLHSTFAHLEQKELGITWRLNYTFTPTATLQLYAQPFVSKGTYSDVREVSANPRANDYDARFIAYGDTAVSNNPGGFNFQAVPLQRGVSLGVPAGLDPVPGLEPGAGAAEVEGDNILSAAI